MRVLLHFDKTALFSDLVRERFPDAEIRCCNTYADLPRVLQEFAPVVLFCIKFENRPYPRDAVLECRSLQWVSNGGAGVDHLTPWDPRRLIVTNAAGVASEVMATYVLGGILALAMGFPRFLDNKARQQWQWQYVESVIGRTLVVVGLGHTGQAVARLAHGMGMRVVGTRARPRPTEHVARVFSSEELPAALALGDYVVISVPLLEGTHHLIDAGAMESMKPGARLVDVSRGGVVDEKALVDALRSGKLGGAVLDVFEREPLPPSSPLWKLDNVILTPHCSSVYQGWERRTAEMFCDNLDRWMVGEALENVVDPARGY
jgi:phosphoglycerate dehydrogenase-like enzyme